MKYLNNTAEDRINFREGLPWRKYRIIAGRHIDVDREGREVIYSFDRNTGGDIFESQLDLAERWPAKFQRMESFVPNTTTAPVPAAPITPVGVVEPPSEVIGSSTHALKVEKMMDADTLDRMTITELRAYAEQEEINLTGITKKDDILRILKEDLEEM